MPPCLVLPEHAHEPGQVCFILEGAYRERTSGGESVLRSGDVIFHAPGERHANAFGGAGALTLLVSVERRRWIDLLTRRPSRSAVLAEIASAMRTELARDDASSATALEGLSLILLSRVARLTPDGAEPVWVLDAVSRIEQNFDQPLTLSSLAEQVGVHRATLAAAFRRFRDTSVGELIRSVRIARAREALEQTREPIDEIAQRTGFADQAHLGRVFKRITGLTPGEYRRYTSKSSK